MVYITYQYEHCTQTCSHSKIFFLAFPRNFLNLSEIKDTVHNLKPLILPNNKAKTI